MMLGLMWRSDLLSRPGLVATWVAAGIALQYFGVRYSPMWLVGLLINVSVAIYLSIRLKLS